MFFQRTTWVFLNCKMAQHRCLFLRLVRIACWPCCSEISDFTQRTIVKAPLTKLFARCSHEEKFPTVLGTRSVNSMAREVQRPHFSFNLDEAYLVCTLAYSLICFRIPLSARRGCICPYSTAWVSFLIGHRRWEHNRGNKTETYNLWNLLLP